MKQDKDKIIEQMLSLAAIEEEQTTYSQKDSQEEPVLSPDFRERIMEMNRQYLQRETQRKTQFRRWACAAAAALVIGTVGLTGAHSWIQRQNRPETIYTIGQLPENCTQTVHQTSSDTAFTMWKANGSNIVLMQDKNSLIRLMENQSNAYGKWDEVHTDKLDGYLFMNAQKKQLVLAWQEGDYFFLLTMDGELNQQEALIRMASNLTVV